jgi:hypothetical protein
MVTTRPPTRSVSMPAGRRHSDPLSTATAEIHASSGSLSPSSFWIGTPRMPNISHTANISVKAIVDIVRTRLAPLDTSGWAGAVSGSVVRVMTVASIWMRVVI